jgi:hypothetical protein
MIERNKRCPHCGFLNYNYARYCINCKRPLDIPPRPWWRRKIVILPYGLPLRDFLILWAVLAIIGLIYLLITGG